MQVEIKKAISKAMAKLVGFSLNEKATKAGFVQVNLMPQCGHSIWIWHICDEVMPIRIINAPGEVKDIPAYKAKIEKAIAELTVKFHTVAEVMANLESEVNE